MIGVQAEIDPFMETHLLDLLAQGHGHIDQFYVALRYLENHVPVERFFTYLPNVGHIAVDMLTAVENLLVQRGKYSLNLVGAATMDACSDSKKFSDFLKELYVFFLPTERHKLLTKKLGIISSITESLPLAQKRVDTTRWGPRGSVKSVKYGYSGYKEALSELSGSCGEAKSPP
ncbi:hypothetical protein QAD02_007202 [Eretmocerus hayati]|uniref:Uncharacterized protein n=1 Tax=Eretmocerus hayati TaxID=131215 RepID=A0ACC2N2Z4_9HYME|nr:hypothetical protein QAD02_007202 [Eretmocerus hayati]